MVALRVAIPHRYGHSDAPASFHLPETYSVTVVSTPRQNKQVALALTRIEREHECSLQCFGRHSHEGRDVLLGPNLLGSVGVVKVLDAFRRTIDCKPPSPCPPPS